MDIGFQQNTFSWITSESERIFNEWKLLKKPKVVNFQVGFGPSGPPHIGTLSEIIRTFLVQKSFLERVSLKESQDLTSDLILFSDDRDPLRSLPCGVSSSYSSFLDMPLSTIPSPFDQNMSYAEYYNSKLLERIQDYNIPYTFYSATHTYKSGHYNELLIELLKNIDAIKKIIIPTLQENRQKTYSPFMPICPKTGKILYLPVIDYDIKKKELLFNNNGEDLCIPLSGSHIKLQWKIDWAVRWKKLLVFYEMHGKDLYESYKISKEVIRILKGQAPLAYTYELFLDKDGSKISKSKGNSIPLEHIAKSMPIPSIIHFLCHKPKTAKRFSFNEFPLYVDNYIKLVSKGKTEQINNILHFPQRNCPSYAKGISFTLFLNLCVATNPESISDIQDIIQIHHKKKNIPLSQASLDLIEHVYNYYCILRSNVKTQRNPLDEEERIYHKAILSELLNKLIELKNKNMWQDEAIQNAIFTIGKNNIPGRFNKISDFFCLLYRVLLEQNYGPRISSLIMYLDINRVEQKIRTEKINDYQ